MKKMKERIFSIVLTLVMVVALFAGMAPMDVHAAATQEPTEEELNCILTTVDVTLEVGAQYIQCSQLPEVTSENYKWAYFYYPAPSNMEGYEECVLGLIASVQETIGVTTMSNCKAAHREKYNQLINEIPSNGQIPVSGDGYGLLYIVQIYDYPIDVSNSGYRYYYNKVAMFDVSKGGTVSNGLVGEETTPISITQQPESVTVNIGAKVTFSVTATGDNLTYKWQVAYGSDKEFGDAYGNGNGTATFTTDGTDKDFNGYRYRCIITDENGNSVTSDVATLTLIGAEPPTEIPGVSIAKTADGYKVTGLGAVEEGYRWGYCPYTLREGEDLDGAVTAKLNEHLTDGPWQNEIANSFDESYEITTYTFPGRAPESIDNYDYIEIVKLNENGFPSEVAVLPLPKDAAPEVTYDITLDRTNYADGYVELYTYNSEGTNVAVTQENNATIAMPEGGKVRVFAGSAFTVTAEGATVGEMLNAGEEGYYYEITNFTGDTTVVVNPRQNAPVHTHSLTLVPAKAATCTTDGNKAYYTCSGCDSLFTDANGTTTTTAEAVKIAALGHDWTGEWTITKEATATEEGKKETLCERDDCGQKKVVIIPITGTTDDNANLEKDAEVEPEAPIDEATLNNSKEELLGAGNIFEDAEKAQIENGTDARVWLEVTKTDESAIASTDKAKIEQEATQIMGDNLVITYFDADLFKQVGTNERTPVPEPGIAIKITITIPDELLNSDGTISREYQIIRLHEGQVDVISGTFDSATGEFTFESDKFSTYAIVYKDVPVNDNPNPTPAPGGENPTPVPGGENPTPAPGGENPTPAPGGGENPTPAPSNNDVVNSGENKLDEVPKTGESNVTLYFFILMLLSGAGVVICSRIKKNSNKES